MARIVVRILHQEVAEDSAAVWSWRIIETVWMECQPMGSAALKSLMDKAMALGENERAELAHELLISLDGPVDVTAPEALAAEIHRRVEEIDAGSVQLVDAEDVVRRIQKRISDLQ